MKRQSGFAMLAALMLMALLAIIAIAVLSLAAADRRRAVRHTRIETRENCTFSGLTYARTFFGNNFPNWNQYFALPNKYNPINLPSPTSPSWTQPKADLSSTSSVGAIRLTHPNLFLDLDSDGAPDVYIFIRDNFDEFPPAPANFQRDNDQNAIVGAVCISPTMLPRRDDGTIDTDRLMMESLLAANPQSSTYSQSSANGNMNNVAAN